MRGKLTKTHVLSASAVVAIAIIFSFFFFNSTLTGQSILNIDGNFVNGQLEDGKLNFLISGGELIPTDTKIIIENNGSTYEYVLKDILPTQEIQGEYYLEGTTLTGEGLGFGKIGKIIQTPEISFEFEIIEKNESTNTTTKDSGSKTINTNNSEKTNEEVIVVSEENTTEENDTKTSPEENITQETTNTQNQTNSEETSNIETTGNVTDEKNAETSPEEETTQETTTTPETNTETSPEETTAKTTPEQEIQTEVTTQNEEIPKETTSEENQQEPVSEEPTPEPAPSESEPAPSESPSIVETATAAVAGFFLPLTGRVTEEGSIVSGTVKKGDDFTYSGLLEKEIRIVPESVRINEEKKSEDLLQHSIDQEGNLIIKTDYSITQEGFGPEYKTSEIEKISIDLNKLNLSLKEGPIKIKLIYNNSEYFSIEDELTQGFIDELNQNTTIMENTTEIILLDRKFDFNLSLTDVEKELIKKNVDFPVVSTDVKETESRYTAKFSLGDYSTLHTYPKTISEEVLAKNIERDRILWLKDITTSLNETRFENTTTLTNLSQDYPVF